MPRKQPISLQAGFSLMELMISMTVMIILLTIVASLIARSMSVKARESQRADAITSAEAALNVIFQGSR